MTRKLTVAAEFEQGTLIEATTTEEYIVGENHAYYVPDKARLDAGMQKVRATETIDAYRNGETGFDWDGIRDTVSAIDIVELAEQDTINRTDGDIGDARRRGIRWSPRGADEHVTVPAGVVKFADPDADRECGATRDPVERGLMWGALKDRVLTDVRDIELQYHNDVQQGGLRTARVPIAVYKKGTGAIIAYLAAHDQPTMYIAATLEVEREDVVAMLERYRNLA
ncbi:hypothetical protein ACFQMM_22390 [Saliphagus sp. GCM10025308]